MSQFWYALVTIIKSTTHLPPNPRVTRTQCEAQMSSIRVEGVVEGVEAEGRGESTKKVGGTMVSCYFGKMCRNAQCRFDHSEKHRFADSLKWRRSESSWKWASCCGVSGRRGEASGKTRACRFGPYCRHPYCRSVAILTADHLNCAVDLYLALACYIIIS